MNGRQLKIVLRTRDEASRTLREVAEETNGLTSVFKNNFKEAGLMDGAVVGGLTLATRSAVENAAAYEQNRFAFDSMLGGFGKGRGILKEISDFARQTLFDLPQANLAITSEQMVRNTVGR